jgi:hypothetical protein
MAPMLDLLKEHELPAESDHEDEITEAVTIILKSGLRYDNVSIHGFVDGNSYNDNAIVRLHDLARNGRRVFVVVDEIAAIETKDDG